MGPREQNNPELDAAGPSAEPGHLLCFGLPDGKHDPIMLTFPVRKDLPGPETPHVRVAHQLLATLYSQDTAAKMVSLAANPADTYWRAAIDKASALVRQGGEPGGGRIAQLV
jgi:hypothetical protein